MLPTHLNLSKLEKLVRDHCTLTAEDCSEAKPIEMLIGYLEGSEYGGTPYENPESDETDPLTRLGRGEQLVIQRHLGLIQDEAQCIDGETYSATEKEVERDEEGDSPDEACFPDETGFFGLGLRLDGDRLALEPVRISGDFNGNICVGRAQFPPSLAKRTASYLKGWRSGWLRESRQLAVVLLAGSFGGGQRCQPGGNMNSPKASFYAHFRFADQK